VVANAVTAKVGASGQISVFNGSAGCNDVVVDVAGYFTAGTPAAAQGGFTGITPYRVRDTRTVGGCLAPNSTLTIQTAGVGDIPGDAAALALNVTTVKPTAAGYITVHPTGVQRPVASNLNFAANRIVPNAVNIGIGNSGSIDLFNGSGGCTHVIVDIVGYFRPTTNPVAPSITGLTPATGRTTGGNTVMISGNGFSNSTAVTFGTIPATSFTIDSPTQITAIAPPAVAGEVTVAVTSLGGSSPTSINSKYTYVLDTLTGASSVVSARDHGCALTSGTVKCWGSNINGQLGNGTTTDSLRPVTVTGITTATAIAAQAWATCALLSNGTVKCWGDNSAGQLGNGTTTAASSPVTVSGITGATAIAAGEEFACAIVAGGAAKCWGYNRFGQLGNGTTSDSLTPVSVSGLSGATAISAGWAHVCALVAGGSAKCWGYGSDGQLGNGTKGGSTQSTVPADVAGLTAATSIDVGTHYSCATLTSGSLKCWGWGPGTGSSLANPGVTTPVAVAGISGATGVTVGNRTVCAIVTSGKVRCLGANWSGELGIGTTVPDSTETPVEVSGLSAATSISAGGASLYFDDGYFTSVCAVVANGAVNCWGYGSFGQLGNGTFDDALLPTDVLAAG
jgi:alpha-tubulin suppressor-like RCC1 family protein